MIKRTLLIVTLLFTSWLNANTDHRLWTIADGKKITASLVEVDDVKKTITLKLRGSHKRLEIAYEGLNTIDSAWIQRHRELENELDVVADKLKGVVAKEVALGTYQTAYSIYYPSAYQNDDYLPLVLLFSSSGREKNLLRRHMEAAEKVGFILVCPDKFRNTHNEPDFDKELEVRFAELCESIRANIPFDNNHFYLGGDSGGAYRAYHYTYQFTGPWAGVYANVGWLGGYKFYDKPYPSGMRVAMCNGHLDNSRWLENDKALLESKGSTVKVFVFEGGHQLAPVHAQVKSFSWMMEGKKPYLGLTEDKRKFRKTEKLDDTKYSSEEALSAALRIYNNVNLRGKSKSDILALLGSPRTINDFGQAYDNRLKDDDLLYIIRTPSSELRIQFTFEDEKVVDINRI